MVKTIRGAPAAAAGIDAPAGIQFVPAANAVGSSGRQYFVTVFKDTTGKPDRCIVVGRYGASFITVIEYKLLNNQWVFDPADCARDDGVTLTVTATSVNDIQVFAIDNPAGTGDRVLFVTTNDTSQTPDTFEINSIVLTPGSTSLTAVLSVVAGTNQPPDTDGMVVVSIPLSTARLMTFFQDDAHFADITESGGTYTFTYDDAKVLAVAVSINPTTGYAGVCIGSQVLIGNISVATGNNAMWEMSTSAVLTEEFTTFLAGGVGTYQSVTMGQFAAITAIGGSFAVASPYGGGDTAGEESAYILTTFPLDDI